MSLTAILTKKLVPSTNEHKQRMDVTFLAAKGMLRQWKLVLKCFTQLSDVSCMAKCKSENGNGKHVICS